MTAVAPARALTSTPIVDVDSHILEPPDLWTSRLPSKWRDVAPRPVVTDPASGTEKWLVGDAFTQGAGSHASAEWKDHWPSRPPNFGAATRGAWDAVARLAWMDRCGVYAQVQYPNLLGFHMWAFLKLDEDVRLACVRAYNDFQAEFCAADPNRLIPLMYLPWWDVEESIAEVERCLALGHRGVNFGYEFERLGFPPLRDRHWQSLLRCIEETGLSVSFHIGFNSNTEEQIVSAMNTQDTLDLAKVSALMFMGNTACIADLLMGQICHRFPTLRFVSVESGFGYVPFLLEALDWQFLNSGGAVKYPDLLLPSEYFRRQIYATFWFERHLVRTVDLYPDNVMFETDYPHATSLSPGDNSIALPARETLERNLAGLPDDLVAKLLYENAAKVYDLPPLATGAPHAAAR